jgi:hypothetical protein
MARKSSALYQLGTVVMDLTDDTYAVANRDGVIDAAERHIIETLRYISNQLERGDRARLRSQAIEISWSLDDTPHMRRQIRELKADLGDDGGPDGGAPMLKAA